jgi:adenosine/AMP kinase
MEMPNKEGKMELKPVRLEFPEGCNIILGQSHFIKTVEDLYEIMITHSPQAKFGIAFCEASGKRLIRFEGNDQELIEVACKNLQRIAAGHTFLIVMKNAYPINVINAVKNCQEVCRIFCATANPVEVIVAETEQGRGVIGVIDGYKPLGIEKEEDRRERKEFLRKIGYKL